MLRSGGWCPGGDFDVLSPDEPLSPALSSAKGQGVESWLGVLGSGLNFLGWELVFWGWEPSSCTELWWDNKQHSWAQAGQSQAGALTSRGAVVILVQRGSCF